MCIQNIHKVVRLDILCVMCKYKGVCLYSVYVNVNVRIFDL